jgi:hypothetical protein
LDLHPFFHTLVRVTNSSSLTKTSADGLFSGSSDLTRASVGQFVVPEEDPTVYLNQILEKDFLEEVPLV